MKIISYTVSNYQTNFSYNYLICVQTWKLICIFCLIRNDKPMNASCFSGNMMGQKPFKKGTPCSECSSGQFFCTEGMCDRTYFEDVTKLHLSQVLFFNCVLWQTCASLGQYGIWFASYRLSNGFDYGCVWWEHYTCECPTKEGVGKFVQHHNSFFGCSVMIQRRPCKYYEH